MKKTKITRSERCRGADLLLAQRYWYRFFCRNSGRYLKQINLLDRYLPFYEKKITKFSKQLLTVIGGLGGSVAAWLEPLNYGMEKARGQAKIESSALWIFSIQYSVFTETSGLGRYLQWLLQLQRRWWIWTGRTPLRWGASALWRLPVYFSKAAGGGSKAS